MKRLFPKKSFFIRWHKRTGITAAIFLVCLSVTGIILNHTERLGLDRITLRNAWILKHYGMATPEDIRAYTLPQNQTLYHLDGQLYLQAQPITRANAIISIASNDFLHAIATSDQLILITHEGELIEKRDTAQLPYTTLHTLAQSPSGAIIFQTNTGQWQPDEQWLTLNPYQGEAQAITTTNTTPHKATVEHILNQHQGAGVSLYRVILDLHSGRLFGWTGRTLMDISAIALILLVVSGLVGWYRPARKQRS